MLRCRAAYWATVRRQCSAHRALSVRCGANWTLPAGTPSSISHLIALTHEFGWVKFFGTPCTVTQTDLRDPCPPSYLAPIECKNTFQWPGLLPERPVGEITALPRSRSQWGGGRLPSPQEPDPSVGPLGLAPDPK